MNTKKVWNEFLKIVKANTSDYSFETWFMPLYINSINEDVNIIYIASKENHVPRFIQDRYLSMIEDTFENITGKRYKVVVKYEGEYLNEGKSSLEGSNKKIFDQSKLFNPRLNFRNFVVGECNKFAHAAALAVAESPAVSFNPLFLYGGSGLGKTHLMQAIGIHIIENNPSAKVIYVSSEMFTNELIAAISENKTKSFKNKYRKADILLIDDIQFLENKNQMQEEFFHTFNALYDNDKQIVISSDRRPSDLVNLDERLRTRFSWNLIADIQPADFETRVAILKKKTENAGIAWNNDMLDVCSLISEQIPDNIRELEGALNNVIGFSNLLNEPIDIPFAKRILKDVINDNNKAIAPERIRTIVSRYYKIKVSDLDSQKRNAEIAFPRQVAMFLCREKTDLSHQKIGRLFGNRHYSTVIHSYEKISDLERKDSSFREELNDLRNKIKEVN